MLYPGRGSMDGRRGDHVLIAAPYNITKEQIDEIVERTKMAIENAFETIVS